MSKYITILFILVHTASHAQYAPAAGQSGSTAISKNDINIVGWATSCSIERGWLNISDTAKGKASYGEANDAVGTSNPAVVSLGDEGVAILSFNQPISNIDGFDFAVFENSFDDNFLELAHVEVSSNGIDFVRFSSISLTDTTVQVNSFGIVEATDLYNLAGKYRGQYGTPFDLEELKDSSSINVDSINYVKIVDVVGSVNSSFGSFDSQGNIINDPYPTDFESGGFDLDAVAVLGKTIFDGIENEVDELTVYPNPVNRGDVIHFNQKGRLINLLGSVIFDVDSSNLTFKI